MYREVSDLSFGSEDEDHVKAPPQFGSAKAREGSNDSLWKTYTNNLDKNAEIEQMDDDNTLQDSADSAGELPHTRGTVRFNATFERSQDEDQQSDQAGLPASWAACDMTDLAVVAAHLASAALPPAQQSANDQYATNTLLLHSPLEAEDMLGFGTLDLRSCTLTRRSAAFATTQRLGMLASFSHPVQVHPRIAADIICTADAVYRLQIISIVQVAGIEATVARTSSVFRHGSSVGEQLQALASRTGMSFSGGLRFAPKLLGMNFSDLKKQVEPPPHCLQHPSCICAF